MQKVDSLKIRYFYKTLGNLFSLAAGVIAQMIFPRGLGVIQYGNFSFLTDFFTQFLAFFNIGSSVGFYTKLSKRPQESKLIIFYLLLISLGTAIAFLTVLGVSVLGWQGRVWPGQKIVYIYAAVIFAGLTFFMNGFNDVVDARGHTVPLEKSRIFQKVAAIFLVLFLFRQQLVTMGMVFCFNYLFFLVAIFFSFRIAQKGGVVLLFEWLSSAEVKNYTREFWDYSRPLLLLGVVNLGAVLFDRWFLQLTGGGIEQGFYSLSFRVGALCFVFSGAMTQLITREFSIAHKKQDLEEMARLFRRHIPLLYGITAVIACFVAVNAGKVAVIMGGREFSSAILPVSIMSLYPLHQTYGQLSSAVFFASDQVKLYSIICMVFLVLGLPTTYFFLASPAQCGLGLGATGLAVKMVVFNMINNNVLLYLNSRFLKLPFGWYLRHQFSCVAVCLLTAWLVTSGVDRGMAGLWVFWRFLGAGFCYLFVLAGVIYFFPGLLGLGRPDIAAVRRKLTSLIKI